MSFFPIRSNDVLKMAAKFLFQQAQILLTLCLESNLTIATAESCTGGMICGALTSLPGSSAVVECGFVTYSNKSKIQMLGVPSVLIDKFGSVSSEVCRFMAEGAVANSRADIGVSCTGIAGPGGGTESKPVGLVYIAFARKNSQTKVSQNFFYGARSSIRDETVNASIDFVISNIQK